MKPRISLPIALLALLTTVVPEPLEAQVTTVANTNQPDDPDVAVGSIASPNVAHYLVVWVLSNNQLRGQYLDEDGNLVGTQVVFDTVSGSQEISSPSVGTMYEPTSSHFVVAWEVGRAGTTDRDIRCAAALPGQPPQPFLDVASTSATEVHPDVSTGLTSCTIIWEVTGLGIRGADIDLDPTALPEVTQVFDVTQNANDSDPRIGQSPQGESRLVVYRRDNTGSANRIRGRYWTGKTPTSGDFSIRFSNSALSEPDCAAATPEDFYVAWTERESTGTFDDIFGRRVFFPGGSSSRTLGTVVGLAATAGVDTEEPAVCFSGNTYFFASRQGGGALELCKTQAIDTMNGTELFSESVAFDGVIYDMDVAPRVRTGIDLDEGCVVWSEPNGSFDTIFAEISPIPGGRVYPPTASGCPGGGETRVSTASEANPGFRMEYWNGEPNQLAYLAVADVALNIPIGAAVLVPDPGTASVYIPGTTTGNGHIGVDIPLPPGLSSTDFWGQWLVFSSGTTCTGFVVTLSDALRFEID